MQGSEAAAFGANGLGAFPPLNSVSPSPLVLLHPPPQPLSYDSKGMEGFWAFGRMVVGGSWLVML